MDALRNVIIKAAGMVAHGGVDQTFGRQVSKQRAKGDGYQQQGLKVFINSEIEQSQNHHPHHHHLPSQMGQASRGEEFGERFHNKFYPKYGLSDG